MKILLFSQHFYPEVVGTARRAIDVTEDLINYGHDVTVIVGIPNHPSTLMTHRISKNVKKEERLFGAQVIRVITYTSTNCGTMHRSLTYGTFMLSALFQGILKKENIDVIVAISPLPTGIAGALTSFIRRTPFIFDLQDIWPEAIMSVRAFNNKSIISFLEIAEKKVYQQAQTIITISDGFKRDIVSRGVPQEKVTVIYNGVDVELFQERDATQIRNQYGWDNKFIVSYIGNIGLAQDLDTVIKIAEMLKSFPEILFLFVGEGVAKEKLFLKAREMDLKNVVFQGFQPRERIPMFLSAADICLVPLIESKVFGITIPSKTYECMAVGRPIITNIRGDVRELIENSNCGVYVEPGQPEQLKEAICRLYQDRTLCKTLGRNGRQRVLRDFSRQQIAAKYNSVLEEAAKYK